MPIELNHTIVETRDQDAGAAWLAEVLGLPAPTRFGPFTVVEVAHGTSLDFMDVDDPHPQHYAFLVPDDEFAVIAARLRDRGVPTYADPGHRRVGVQHERRRPGRLLRLPRGPQPRDPHPALRQRSLIRRIECVAYGHWMSAGRAAADGQTSSRRRRVRAARSARSAASG